MDAKDIVKWAVVLVVLVIIAVVGYTIISAMLATA